MAIHYNTKSTRISSAGVNQVVIANSTILEQGDDPSGNFYVKWQPDSGGCGGGPDSKIYVEIKDDVPWTKISYELFIVAIASCWNFNSGGSQGNGKLLAYNSAIDTTITATNSLENPIYSKTMNLCNNSSNNFMHGTYATGAYRSLFVSRRRDTSLSGLANINVALSCNNYGAGKYIIIRNIFVR